MIYTLALRAYCCIALAVLLFLLLCLHSSSLAVTQNSESLATLEEDTQAMFPTMPQVAYPSHRVLGNAELIDAPKPDTGSRPGLGLLFVFGKRACQNSLGHVFVLGS